MTRVQIYRLRDNTVIYIYQRTRLVSRPISLNFTSPPCHLHQDCVVPVYLVQTHVSPLSVVVMYQVILTLKQKMLNVALRTVIFWAQNVKLMAEIYLSLSLQDLNLRQALFRQVQDLEI